MISIGKRIRKAREAVGVTQEELAERIGVSRSAVARWELGEIEPKLRNLIALATELDVSTDELLGISVREDPGEIVRRQMGLSKSSMDALVGFITELKNES